MSITKNANPIMPSTKMLPMDQIAQELRFIHKFVKDNDTVGETRNVSGVEANKIAVAATDDKGNLIEGRDTVKNALKLGSLPASDYMTKATGAVIEEIAKNVSNIYSEEIMNLRDELYSVKSDLLKAGVVRQFNNYNGFCDAFVNKIEGFMDNEYNIVNVPAAGTCSTLQVGSSSSDFEIGEYIIIEVTDSTNSFSTEYFSKITAVSGPDISFDPSVTIAIGDKIKVLKQLGNNLRGTFSFSNEKSNSITNKEKVTMLNDDKYTRIFSITKANQGYAMCTYIPSVTAGALNKLTIKASIEGAPGQLRCYVIDSADINTFSSIQEAITDGKVLATSAPVNSTGSLNLTDIEFNFNPKGSTFFELKTDTKYCFIFEAASASEKNKWNIMMTTQQLNSQATDIKTNVDLWEYNLVPVGTSGSAFTQTLELKNYDLFYTISTMEISTLSETPYNVGLYSVKKELPAPIEMSKIRVNMKVSREGYSKVTSTSQEYVTGDTITTGADLKLGSVSGTENLSINDTIVIGNTINTIHTASSGNLTLQNDTIINKEDPVYRIGYIVRVSAKGFEKGTNTPINFSKEMPLVRVIPDGIYKNQKLSDSLIFETDLKALVTDKTKYFTEYEIQIGWKTNRPISDLATHNALIGRISSINTSVIKTI